MSELASYCTEEFLDQSFRLMGNGDTDNVHVTKCLYQLQSIYDYFSNNMNYVPVGIRTKFEAYKMFLRSKMENGLEVAKDQIYSNPKFSSIKNRAQDLLAMDLLEKDVDNIMIMVYSRYSFCQTVDIVQKINSFYKTYENGDYNDPVEVVEACKSLITSSFLDFVQIESKRDDQGNEAELNPDTYDSVYDNFLDYYQTKITKVKTGISEFDIILSGGLEGCRLYTFAARSGSGKSLTLINLCRMAMETLSEEYKDDKDSKIAVVYITLENLVHETLNRFFACATETDSYTIKQGKEATKQVIRNTMEEKFSGVGFFVKYFSPNSVTCSDIMFYLDSLKLKGYKIKLVAVDYLDNLNPTVKEEQYRLALGQITKELKGVALKFGCPVLTATQFNKSSYGAQGQDHMGMIGESGKKIDWSDCVVLLNLEEDSLTFHISKNRDGKSGVSFTLPVIKNCYRVKHNVVGAVEDNPKNQRSQQSAKHKITQDEITGKTFKVDHDILYHQKNNDSPAEFNLFE